jgi:AcrR family transcriptional regulator
VKRLSKLAPRTTEDQWNKTHQKIMNTAQTLFATKGYNGTSINDIVKESGVSKGAIYNHFENKERLFMSLLDIQTEIGLEQIQSIFSEDDTSIDKLKKIFKTTFSSSVACTREICMMQTEFMVTASRTYSLIPDLQRRYHTIQKFVVDIIEEGKKLGEIKQEIDSENLVTLVFATLDGLGFQYATLGIRFDVDSLEKLMMEMVFRDLEAES